MNTRVLLVYVYVTLPVEALTGRVRIVGIETHADENTLQRFGKLFETVNGLLEVAS